VLPEPVSVLLVDDEPLARQGLRDCLAGCAEVHVVGEAGDGLAAVSAIEDLQPAIVFLDVQMPGLDGFEVLGACDPARRPVVVFATAYDRYALRAFEVHAADYLLKPYDDARCRTALQRAVQRLQQAPEQRAATTAALLDEVAAGRRLQRFVVKHAGRLRVVQAVEVEWIEAAGNYVHLHHRDGPFLLRQTLSALERALDPARFVRVHRSAIVALAAVVDFERVPAGDHELRLASGARVALSRSHRTAFERALGRPR
jgi:two-component system LytT family response regulator